jgi:hypothetical protein
VRPLECRSIDKVEPHPIPCHHDDVGEEADARRRCSARKAPSKRVRVVDGTNCEQGQRQDASPGMVPKKPNTCHNARDRENQVAAIPADSVCGTLRLKFGVVRTQAEQWPDETGAPSEEHVYSCDSQC